MIEKKKASAKLAAKREAMKKDRERVQKLRARKEARDEARRQAAAHAAEIERRRREIAEEEELQRQREIIEAEARAEAEELVEKRARAVELSERRRKDASVGFRFKLRVPGYYVIVSPFNVCIYRLYHTQMRNIEALKTTLLRKLEEKNIDMPRLLGFGPGTAPNNSPYYKNPRAYARALSSIIQSIDARPAHVV